jgi:hypothetical protein
MEHWNIELKSSYSLLRDRHGWEHVSAVTLVTHRSIIPALPVCRQAGMISFTCQSEPSEDDR